MSSTETPAAVEFQPTKVDAFTAQRILQVTLTSGLQIECRRLDLMDLLFIDGITMPLFAAASELTSQQAFLDEDSQPRRQQARQLYERIACAAALRPSITADDTRRDALAVRLLSYTELVELANKVVGLPKLPGGAATAESFRDARRTDDEAAPRPGEGVRPAAEPSAAVDLQHR